MKSSLVGLSILAALLGVGMVVSLRFGAEPLGVERVLAALFDPAARHTTDGTIVWELRLPRILLAAVVGGGLGMAGAGYQGLFRNPLADPFVIGASSGAALGATIAIVAGWRAGVVGMGAITAAALAGALLAVGVVYGIATVGRQVQTLSLLLAGVAVSSFLGSVVSLLMFLNEDDLVTIMGWLLGSLSGRGWPVLRTSGPLIVAGGAMLWVLSRGLDALTFGEESAASLGMRLGKLRGLVVVAASLATAAAVSTGGVIGFVGLIAPHVARMLVGARHALVIPASGLVGAILLVAADDLARTLAAPSELPVGVVTALLGSPFFIYLLKTRARGLGSGT